MPRRGFGLEMGECRGGADPDVVLAGAGVYPTAEVVAAAAILCREVPELRVRVVNVTDLLILETDTFHPHDLSPRKFSDLFTADRPVVFNSDPGGTWATLVSVYNERTLAGREALDGLDPALAVYRHIGQSTTAVDLVRAEEMFTILMGDEVEPRRDFIDRNAMNVRNLDI